MKQLFLSFSVLALIAAPLAAHAAPCRDAKGRFTSCHGAAAKPAAAKPAAAKPADTHPMAKATPAPHATLAAHAAPRPSASPAAKHCKIGNRFASCSAPGAKPV